MTLALIVDWSEMAGVAATYLLGVVAFVVLLALVATCSGEDAPR